MFLSSMMGWMAKIGGVVATGSISLIKIVTPATATASASMQFNADGTMTYSNGSGITNWFQPVTTGIGSSNWARLTLGTAPATTSGPAAGTWVSLATAANWLWSVTGGIKIGTFTVDISDTAAGTVIRGTYSGSVDVESTA